MERGGTYIVHTKSKGRCLCAAKAIKAGRLLLREEPLVCVPSAQSPLPGVSLDSGPFRLSAKEQSLYAAAAANGARDLSSAVLASRLIRACLLSADKASKQRMAAWDELTAKTIDNPKWQEGLQTTAEIVHRLVTSSRSSSAQAVSRKLCATALEKVSCNVFSINIDDGTDCGIGLYSKASAINHSCFPNAVQRFGPQGQIEIFVARDIAAHEEITIAYIDISYPYWKRQHSLSYYGFHCSCSRCSEYSVAQDREYLRCPKCRLSTDSPQRAGWLSWSAQRSRQQYLDWLQGLSFPPLTSTAHDNVWLLPFYEVINREEWCIQAAKGLKQSQPQSTTRDRFALECDTCHSALNLLAFLPAMQSLRTTWAMLEDLPSEPVYRAERGRLLNQLTTLAADWLPRDHCCIFKYTTVRSMILMNDCDDVEAFFRWGGNKKQNMLDVFKGHPLLCNLWATAACFRLDGVYHCTTLLTLTPIMHAIASNPLLTKAIGFHWQLWIRSAQHSVDLVYPSLRSLFS